MASTRTRGRPKEPVSEQVYQGLKAEVLRCALAEEKALPSEQTLTETFAVSRMTLRKALGRIAEEGWIVRQAGRGTFVNAERLAALRETAMVEQRWTPAAPDTAGGAAVLDLGSVEYPASHHAFWEERVETFRRACPEASLRFRPAHDGPPPWFEARSTQELPDAFQITGAELLPLVRRGLVMNLEPLVETAPAASEGLAEASLEACRVEGRLQAWPQERSIPILHANLDLCASLDLDEATRTHGALLAAAERACPRLPRGASLINLPHPHTLMMYFGVFSPETWPEPSAYRGRAAQACAEWVARMAAIPGALHDTRGDAAPPMARFLSGQLALFHWGTLGSVRLRTYAAFPLRLLRPPRDHGGCGDLQIVAWAMRRDAPHPVHTWRWLRSLTEESVQRRIPLEKSNLPARDDALPLDDPAWTAWTGSEALVKEMNACRPLRVPGFLRQRLVNEVWEPALHRLRRGEIAPRDALARMEEAHATLDAALRGGGFGELQDALRRG